MNEWTRIEGAPVPLGAAWIEEEQAYNFALYSRHASGVTLLVYSEANVTVPILEHRLDYLKNKSGRVWHCRIPLAQVQNGRYYGYRVEGPADDSSGHRFDPAKVLIDPYATGILFPPAFSRDAARRPGGNDGRAPLGLLPRRGSPFAWNGDARPGDNLYTCSVLAIEPKTGKLRWHFQFTPHDVHDWDANQIPILLDAEVGGRSRRLLASANRNAFYYLLDRETGEFLHGSPYAKQNWAEFQNVSSRRFTSFAGP